jgi:hypothetical protein
MLLDTFIGVPLLCMSVESSCWTHFSICMCVFIVNVSGVQLLDTFKAHIQMCPATRFHCHVQYKGTHTNVFSN